MNGRQQVAAHRARVDAIFARAKKLEESGEIELRSDIARYLCVVVSGFLEKSISEMLLQHARKMGAPTLQRFVEFNVGKFTNANCNKILAVLSSFNQQWELALRDVLVDEFKESINSVIANRHLVAHGGNVGLTYRRMVDYYESVDHVVTKIIELCDPLPE